MKPAWPYVLFVKANELHMTVHKYLTGRDGPLLAIEWHLQQKFARATHVLEKQKGKKGRGR